MYDKDYLEYDEYGLKEVRCMRCNTPVKRRYIDPVTMPDGRTIGVYKIKTLSNFVPAPFTLSDGSYTNILLDKDCAKKIDNSPEEVEGMGKQFRKGFELEAAGARRSKDEIKDIKERFKKIEVSGSHNFEKAREKSKERIKRRIR